MPDTRGLHPIKGASLPAWLNSRAVAWAGALLTLLVVLLTASFLLHERRSLEDGEVKGAELYARVLQDHAERSFNAIDLALGSLTDAVASAPRGSEQSHLQADLTHALNGLPFLRSLSLMSRDGRVLASSNPANVDVAVDTGVIVLPVEGAADALGGSVQGRDLVDAHRQTGAPARAPSARTFVPLVKEAGGGAGPRRYLVAVLNPDFFGNEYELALDASTRGAGLFTVEGVMLAATGNIRKLPGQAVSTHAFFAAFLPARESGSFIGAGIDGDKVVTAFRVLRQRPLAVVVETNYARIVADFRRTLYASVAACAAALLVIAAMTVLGWRSLRGHDAVSAALASQLEFTAQLLEVSPTPLFVKDDQGRFVTVNRAWLELTNRSLPEVLGRNSADLFGFEAFRHNEEDARLRVSQAAISYESPLFVTGRPPRDTVVTKVRFSRADGTPAGIVGSIIDVTEFRQAEREIRQARDAAHLADSAKSEFIANISHELRTPLQAIIGFSELGRDLSVELPDFAEMFTEIQAGGQRMLMLVNGLLDVSQMNSAVGSLPLQRVDVASLVRDAVGQLQSKAAAGQVQIHLHGLHEPVHADADPVRFQQAVRSVLANAVRHSPSGGCIDVGLTDKGAFGVELSVRDHGPGVPEAELERIFDAFVQSSRTKDGSGGTGLGLTIARKIMSAHGGSVVAANAEGGGALFSLSLPATGVVTDANAALSWQDADGLLFASEVT